MITAVIVAKRNKLPRSLTKCLTDHPICVDPNSRGLPAYTCRILPADGGSVFIVQGRYLRILVHEFQLANPDKRLAPFSNSGTNHW